jgi:hypothetical protein
MRRRRLVGVCLECRQKERPGSSIFVEWECGAFEAFSIFIV